MWMIIMIVLVVSLMVGPIMMMRPSQGDAKVARLRILALSKNLKVSMIWSPYANENISLPVYFLPWSANILKKYPEFLDWTLYRENFEHGIHFHGAWNWTEDKHAPPAWFPMLKDFLDQCKEEDSAVHSSRAGLGLVWREKLNGRTEEEAVQKVFDRLSELSAKLH